VVIGIVADIHLKMVGSWTEVQNMVSELSVVAPEAEEDVEEEEEAGEADKLASVYNAASLYFDN